MTSHRNLDSLLQRTKSAFDAVSTFTEREPERYALHARYMNEMMVRVLPTIGFDVGFCRGTGQYLFDRAGVRYLDLLSGWGVFGIGRNHPKLREALTGVLAADFPNLVQMDVSPLAGILAEKLLRYAPFLDKVFFANSGGEAVEASLKFARRATGRMGLVYCANAFHGLSYGALSVNGGSDFRNGFGPLLTHCSEVPFNDLGALERMLATRQAAAFIVEPIQGKGVNVPDANYLAGVQELCRKYGTLFIHQPVSNKIVAYGSLWNVTSPRLRAFSLGPRLWHRKPRSGGRHRRVGRSAPNLACPKRRPCCRASAAFASSALSVPIMHLLAKRSSVLNRARPVRSVYRLCGTKEIRAKLGSRRLH
jgi:hypothetical protein